MACEVTSGSATTSHLTAISSLPSFQVPSSGELHAQSAESAKVGQTIPAYRWEDAGKPFEEKMTRLATVLNAEFVESAKLEGAIRANPRGLGHGE